MCLGGTLALENISRATMIFLTVVALAKTQFKNNLYENKLQDRFSLSIVK